MQPPKVDQTDIEILNLLQRDGLLTYKEVSGKLRKSMTHIVERIKKLRTNGYIKSTVALVDIDKLRSHFIAFPHIQLTMHSEDIVKAFKMEMDKYPEVMECYHLTGHFDFMLKVAMPDMVSYNHFLRENIGSLAYVGNIQSFLVLNQSKAETAYAL
ncbi:DNA-binding transcriptional regulator, Lrp family [Pedobacter suwonensis]|uniref:DNA-binding transcriptional regulator, Lrp family n=1 Tax=Pedobacter suwonensis TaxID=332999 RepID=A0A1I0T1R6_9SPHI|nr:Lrp/AsnC family transcriptional regulator [Pedobacter suwonensis]SFA45724.1 DNA-binding transcriptional regulator, Lrp family [Pedobacter suwonensis]